MAKVDSNLLAREKVLFRTRNHWTINARAFVLATICFALGGTLVVGWLDTPVDQRTFSVLMPGEIFLVSGVLIGGFAQWSLRMTEFAVTNQRVLFRCPLNSMDLLLDQVQQVAFHKSRVADYGTIMVTTAGVMKIFDHVHRVEKLAAAIEHQAALIRELTGTAAGPPRV